MNVIRIHPGVMPVLRVVQADEKLRRVHWKAAKDYLKTAKQVLRSGQPGLASKILASGRQALAIATAPDAWEMLRSLVREEEAAAVESGVAS
jgi:hypothetical protein